MSRRYLILALPFVLGCSSPNPKLKLSDNTPSNVAVVSAYVPKGTDNLTAIRYMSNVGFTCKIERDETFMMHKGLDPVGVAGSIDFVLCRCYESHGLFVSKLYQVILILDNEDKVKDHHVSYGWIGP
ncbi:MAG: hypothetical protein AAF518_26870 [Spirochaetota bacterium]